jgi:hypothetical protein
MQVGAFEAKNRLGALWIAFSRARRSRLRATAKLSPAWFRPRERSTAKWRKPRWIEFASVRRSFGSHSTGLQ